MRQLEPTKEYLLGSSDLEVLRLEQQHRTWCLHTDRLLAAADFPLGGQVLDLGSGPGFTSVDLASRVGEMGHVLAVDRSSRFAVVFEEMVARLRLPQLSFRQTDVEDLDLPPASLDGAFARWLFCFLKEPELLIDRVGQLLKPGARFAILDYFNYLAAGFQPNHEALRRGFRAVHHSFSEMNGNLDIGNDLPTMLARNGFLVKELIPINEISLPGDPFWTWFRTFHKVHFPGLVENGSLNEAEAEAFEQALAEREVNPGAFFFTPPMIGIVAVKR